MEPVPTIHVATRDLPLEERLPAFRQMTAALYDVWPLRDAEDFEMDATGYRVGSLVFNEVAFTPTRFRRQHKHLQSPGSDFLVLQEQLEGYEHLVTDHGVVHLVPGSLYLRDWAHPFDSQGTDMKLRSVVIPRARLAAGTVPEPSDLVLSWPKSTPEGRVMHHLWSELFALLPDEDLGVVETLCAGFLGFLGGILDGDARPGGHAPTLQAMERFLEVRLRGEVGVDDLCGRFNTSRSTVYRLFAPHGGVRRYVNRRRLERCFDDLRFADPDRARVGDIAASWGFFDPSTFTRRFRARFGLPPSRVLGSASGDLELDGSPPPDPVGGPLRDYGSWLDRAPHGP